MQGMTPKFAFRRGSTPTLAFTLPLEVDQSKDKLYISFAQHCREDRHGSADAGGHTGVGSGRCDGAAAVPAARRNRGRLQRDSGRGAADTKGGGD